MLTFSAKVQLFSNGADSVNFIAGVSAVEARRKWEAGQLIIERNGEFLKFSDDRVRQLEKSRKQIVIAKALVPDYSPKAEKSLHQDSRGTTYKQPIVVDQMQYDSEGRATGRRETVTARLVQLKRIDPADYPLYVRVLTDCMASA